MPDTLWYATNRDNGATKRKRGRPRKDRTNMTPTAETNANETGQTPKAPEPKTKPIQNTVFDLQKFDDVKLVKTVTLPAPVTSVAEALAIVGNSEESLLRVINAGLEEHVTEQARKDPSGWFALDDDGDPEETPYSGKYAEGDFGKTVNLAILNFAKMLAMGAGGWDGLKAEQKRAYKEQAVKTFRETPAVLASITGQAAPAAAPETSTPASV